MQFAHYDPATSPAPVIGWYDTSEFDYPNLPDNQNLVAVTASQWFEHFTSPNGWTVISGKLVGPSNE
jgi:hypothetical protein